MDTLSLSDIILKNIYVICIGLDLSYILPLGASINECDPSIDFNLWLFYLVLNKTSYGALNCL